MPQQVFKMTVTSSVRVKGPVITDATSRRVASVVEGSVKTRIAGARNLMDGSAKPLTARYAKWKSKSTKYAKEFRYMRTWTKAYSKYKATGKVGKTLWTKPIQNKRLGAGAGRPVRDLHLSGEMMNNLTIRQATPRRIVLALTGRGPRMKAIVNAKREEWLGYSRQNERDVRVEAANQIASRIGELVVRHTP